MTATAHLFIDYQNLHLTAHECFEPGMPVHHSLIHPGLFANQVQNARNAHVQNPVEIDAIHVFRGQPGGQRESDAAARNKAQRSEWERDRRVTVHTRPLRYPRDWPNSPAREKGVDVMLAVTLMRASIEKWADVLILASRDTDLLPALEVASDVDGATVEVVGWETTSRLRMKTGLWATRLGLSHFQASRDPRVY